MTRLFVDDAQLKINNIIVLKNGQHNKVKNVLRLKKDHNLVLFNNSHKEFVGTIVQCLSHETHVLIIDEVSKEKKKKISISIAMALTKGKKIEWVFQKCTELDVCEFYPLISKRSLIKDVSEHKVERWRRILEEASSQCGRVLVPHLHEPSSFEEYLRFSSSLQGNKIILVEPSHTQENSSHFSKGDFHLLIGPEGGFAQEELILAQEAGFLPLTLGGLTLRAETTPIVITAILQNHFGNLTIGSV